LYYRLKVFHLPLAPLRERPEDVVPLVQSFLDEIARVEGVRKEFTNAAVQALPEYGWPGNVRELRNVVHSATITSMNRSMFRLIWSIISTVTGRLVSVGPARRVVVKF